jgi:uncharacterized protein (DUF983 family)
MTSMNKIFHDFLQTLQWNCQVCGLELGYDRFLPYPFQFIIHYQSFIRCIIVWVADNIVQKKV